MIRFYICDKRRHLVLLFFGTLRKLNFMNRKHFLQRAALGIGGIIAVPYLLFG
jgi:hypothetical protein